MSKIPVIYYCYWLNKTLTTIDDNMLFVLLVYGEGFLVEPMVRGDLGNLACIQSPDFLKVFFGVVNSLPGTETRLGETCIPALSIASDWVYSMKE